MTSGRLCLRLAFAAIRSVAIAVPIAVIGNRPDGDDMLTFARVEDAHALGGAANDRDAVYGAADHLAAIGDEHDLIRIFDRERGDQLAVALIDDHPDDAFAAAAGHPVFIGAGAFAVAILRNRHHE